VKEYVTLMARVDVALADQVKRYANLHRQPISLVIRDALSLLMEEYPAEANPTGSHRLAAHEFLSDRYESPLDTLLGETGNAELEEFVSDRNRAAIAIIDSDGASDREYLSHINEDEDILSDANRDTEIVSDTKAVSADIVLDRNTIATLPTLPEGQVWGKPCEKNPAHVDPQTGLTIRRRGKDLSTPTGYFDRCRACELARKQATRDATRQAGRA